VQDALGRIPAELRAALEYAHGEIVAYHELQVAPEVGFERDGVNVREMVVPVDRAGCYAPGGRADYPSSVLMTAVPARVAGVPEIALCVPPGPDGAVAGASLAAAALAGVDEVYRVGGAQAVAAMAYGTTSIRPVDVIVGPGNAYVAAAKREVAGIVGIESLAGPSEVVVVADGSVSARLVAVDLLAQAEHGPGGAVVLVTADPDVVGAVDAELVALLADSTRREELQATLADVGRAVLVDDDPQAMAVVNVLAPEHLQLMTRRPEALVPLVRNAGAVFCGPGPRVAVGDYVAGANHVLPTRRTARFASALRVDDFRKHIHVVSVDAAGLERVGPAVQTLATAEGLVEHARSISLRIGPDPSSETA
jgi:histidinol dehydrogenase